MPRPTLDEITYSEEATIAAVNGFYDFLILVYLDEDAVKRPPEDGWPSITTDSLRAIGKTDKVVSLLRHLPFISWTGDFEGPQAVPACHFADWEKISRDLASVDAADAADAAESIRSTTESCSYLEHVPPQMVGLVWNSEDQEVFLLDTDLGIVHWAECDIDIMHYSCRKMISDDPYDYASEEVADQIIGRAGTWSIPDFFEVLKERYRKLDFIPVNPTKVIGIRYHGMHEKMMPMLRQIYRQHGWPDAERYRKKKCLQAVYEAIKQHYPGELGFFDDI